MSQDYHYIVEKPSKLLVTIKAYAPPPLLGLKVTWELGTSNVDIGREGSQDLHDTPSRSPPDLHRYIDLVGRLAHAAGAARRGPF